MIVPPAAMILFLADSATFKAQTVILGTVKTLSSSRILLTQTKIFPLLSSFCFISLERAIGYLYTLDY